MDAPCSTRTIRMYLNNEKIKHKKRIHCPMLTMEHKEKRLEYAHQYQTMGAKEWKKVFSDKKKFNLDCPDRFQKYWHATNFPKEEYSTRHSGGGSLMIWWGSSHLQENLIYNLSVVGKKQQIM